MLIGEKPILSPKASRVKCTHWTVTLTTVEKKASADGCDPMA
jgi:hypothetical protein